MARTSKVKPISGEYLFSEELSVPQPKDDEAVILEMHSDSALVGKGYLKGSACRGLAKVDMLDAKEAKCAQIYVEVAGKGDEKQKATLTNSSLTLSKIRSNSEGRLWHDSRLGESRSSKKISVIHRNQDVFFPSEKRFQSYVDKQTHIISYSKLPSMRFHESDPKRNYRGATFGKGEKTDFTRLTRDNPGVGFYKLPSLFDRY